MQYVWTIVSAETPSEHKHQFCAVVAIPMCGIIVSVSEAVFPLPSPNAMLEGLHAANAMRGSPLYLASLPSRRA